MITMKNNHGYIIYIVNDAKVDHGVNSLIKIGGINWWTKLHDNDNIF